MLEDGDRRERVRGSEYLGRKCSREARKEAQGLECCWGRSHGHPESVRI